MFEKVVELFRYVNCPPIRDGQFSYVGPCDKTLEALIKECNSIDECYGRMLFLRIRSDNTAEFEFIVPSGEYSFYSDFSDFIRRTPSLGHGEIPKEFYIVDCNWLSSEGVENPDFSKILKCSELIKSLCKVVLAYDNNSSASYINLFMTISGDAKKPPKAITVSTKVDERVLNCSLNRLNLVKYFSVSENSEKIHFDEKKSLFNTALADVANEAIELNENTFMYIVMHWDKVLDNYWKNLQTYLHGFSFNAIRQEIAKAELEYGSKLGGVFGDIAGKLLALPVSLAALLIVDKTENPLEVWITSIGIFMVTLTFLGILYNQWLNVSRLYNSFSQVFSQMSNRLENYPKNLRSLVKNAKKEVDSQYRFVICTLIFFSALSAVPTIGMIILVWIKWGNGIFEFWKCQL